MRNVASLIMSESEGIKKSQAIKGEVAIVWGRVSHIAVIAIT